MGNCKIDGTYDRTESQKEVKLEENDSSLINKLDGNYPKDKMNKINKFVNNNSGNNSINNINILGKKLFTLKLNNENLGKERNSSNEDELVIITPRLNKNNIGVENYANEITDELTIKNETLVYMGDYLSNKSSENRKSIDKIPETNKINKGKKNAKIEKNKNRNSSAKIGKSNKNTKDKINKSSNVSRNKNNMKNNNKSKPNIFQKDKMGNSKIIKGRIIPKNNNLNLLEKEIPAIKVANMDYYNINERKEQNNQNIIGINNLKQFSGNYFNQRKSKSKKNNKVFNKSYNIKSNFALNPLFESFQFSDIIKGGDNPQSSTLEKRNIELGNLLFQNLPLIKSDEIIPNIERKTYKEDLDSPQMKQKNIENKIKNEFGFENGNMKIPIYKKKTDFHIRNKSYNNINFFKNNMTNDIGNDNNYFSLFNNSANLSINFIHNKFNKTSKNMNQVEPNMNNKNNITERHNKSSCNKKVRMNNCWDKNDNKKSNPYFDYNNFNKKVNPNKKIKNKSSNLQKIKKGISNSRSYNNIFQTNKSNNNQLNNTNSNINNMALSSEQYNDMIEVYIPKTQRKSLINNEIINKAGNKYIFTYEKLDMFNTEQILYDGIIYKVINGVANGETEYKFLERYFQITKNCFKYYNNIKEALKEKEKPLVQFDIRHIQTIEIIENSFLGESKINGNKNINILFCIYIKGNNDFFVFAHYNKYVGNNIINILQFLMRYYEENYFYS